MENELNIYRQLLVITGMFILSFFYLRSFMNGIISYQINRSAYKKRMKQKSFRNWLLFTRFRDVIPKGYIVFYNFLILLHIGADVICIFCSLLKCSQSVGPVIAEYILNFDCLWMIILRLFFWTPGRRIPYERWITKKRGMKPKKRK